MSATAENGAALDQPLSPDIARHEERIKVLLMTRPYRPFEVVLSTGARVVAPRPFSLAIGERTMAPLHRPKVVGPTFPKSLIVEVNVLGSAE